MDANDCQLSTNDVCDIIYKDIPFRLDPANKFMTAMDNYMTGWNLRNIFWNYKDISINLKTELIYQASIYIP